MSVAPVIPSSSASSDCVSQFAERTSSSTCQVDTEPPACAIARSNACVTAREVRVSRRPIGVDAGRELIGEIIITRIA